MSSFTAFQFDGGICLIADTFTRSVRITGQPFVMAIVACYLLSAQVQVLLYQQVAQNRRAQLQPIFFEVCMTSLLEVFAGLWPQWSHNVPRYVWCLLIPPVHSWLMNRSSWTGNAIIIPFHVLG